MLSLLTADADPRQGLVRSIAPKKEELWWILAGEAWILGVQDGKRLA